MGRSLTRDRNVHPSQQQYHPYVNSPSFCQRLFEIACFVLILASVPAWLGGVYSIFVTGYGTALGLLGLLTFGTRRHTCSFLVFAILFFIFVIVVIILNAIHPVGKNLPFQDNFQGPNNVGNAKRSLYTRQDTNSTSSYCSVLANCTLALNNVGQLLDGQLRLNYGANATAVNFHLHNGDLYDDCNRTCYISGSTQLRCDFTPQTTDYTEYCTSDRQLTYAGSSEWWECDAGTGGFNIYTTQYYPQCKQITLEVNQNNCTNTTTGASYDGNAVTGGLLVSNNITNNGTNNGTNSTNSNLGALVAFGGGAFVGSRVYAFIDSGIILLTTLLAIIAGFFVANEFRPAPGTLSHSSTTSTVTRPVTSAAAPGYGNTGYGAPAATGYGAPAASTGGANYAAAPATLAAGGAAGSILGHDANRGATGGYTTADETTTRAPLMGQDGVNHLHQNQGYNPSTNY